MEQDEQEYDIFDDQDEDDEEDNGLWIEELWKYLVLLVKYLNKSTI